jgi:hypothetical protein
MAKQTKQRRRLPTMKDVAKLAGVSQTTVSFVINNTPNANIPEETRQRILAAIEKLGYRPNASAKSLRLRRSQIIGFVTDEIATSPYPGKIIQGAQDAAAAAGKVLLLANTGGEPEIEKTAIETMLEHRVNSIIYATMSHHVVKSPTPLREISSVLLNCYTEDRSLPSVVPDEVKSALTAVTVLLQKGHRRIGFINCVDPVPAASGRLDKLSRNMKCPLLTSWSVMERGIKIVLTSVLCNSCNFPRLQPQFFASMIKWQWGPMKLLVNSILKSQKMWLLWDLIIWKLLRHSSVPNFQRWNCRIIRWDSGQ